MAQARTRSTARSLPVTSELSPPADDACDALGTGCVVVAGRTGLGAEVVFCEGGIHLRCRRSSRILRRALGESGGREILHGPLNSTEENA